VTCLLQLLCAANEVQCWIAANKLLLSPLKNEFLLLGISGQGVQYVHCVMHKCIMVKLGRQRKTHKVCKKTRKFYEIRGKFAKSRGKS